MTARTLLPFPSSQPNTPPLTAAPETTDVSAPVTAEPATPTGMTVAASTAEPMQAIALIPTVAGQTTSPPAHEQAGGVPVPSRHPLPSYRDSSLDVRDTPPLTEGERQVMRAWVVEMQAREARYDHLAPTLNETVKEYNDRLK